MQTFIIKIEDIKFRARNREDAESIAIDIVNDIGGDGEYEIVQIEKK